MVLGGGIGRFARGKASNSEEDAASNKPEKNDNNKEQGLPVASTGDDNDMWMEFDHQPVAPEFEGFGGEIGTDFSYNDGGFNFDHMMGPSATNDTILPENDGHGSNTLNNTTAGGGPMKVKGMGIFSCRAKPSGNSYTIPEAKDASSANKNDSASSAATSASTTTTKPSNPSGISFFGKAHTTASSISQPPTLLKSAPNSQPSISQNQQSVAIACSNPPMPQQRTFNNVQQKQKQIADVSANNQRILPGNSNSTRILPVGPSSTAKKSVTPSPSNAVLSQSTPPLLNHRHAGGNNNNPVVPKPLSQQDTSLIPEKQADAPRLPGTNLDNRNNVSDYHFETPAAPRSRNKDGQSTTMFATPTVPTAVTPSQETPHVLFHKTPASQTPAAAKASQLVTPTTLDSSSFTTTTATTAPNTFQESPFSTSEEESKHDHQGSFGGADVSSFDYLHAKFLGDTRDLEDLQNENASQLLDMDVLLSTALSASLKDQADFMDLLQQLQKEVDLADVTIQKYLCL
jgi:hypothetical protein